MWLPLVTLAISLALILKYFNLKPSKNFWEKHGMLSIDISKMATSLELLFGFKDTLSIDRQVYREMGSSKFCGIVEGTTPVLIVKDLDLVKTVLIKDFDHFTDRRALFLNSKSAALRKMLPALSGHEWRGVRVSMSPTFTTGRMRKLHEIFNSCAVEWVKALKKKEIQDIKDSAGRYATDVIASAVFGMKSGSIQNENSIFLQKTEKLGDSSLISVIRQGLAMRFPKLFKLLKLEAMDESAMKFFDNILTQAIKARESGKVEGRNDFLQLIVEARKGALKSEGNEEKDDLSKFEKEAVLSDGEMLRKNAKEYLLNDDIAKAQGFIFFFAGYHGIAMSITYAIHALAHFKDVQDKLREELEGKFGEDGRIGYDDVNKLVYMEMFVSEIWRYYPVTPRLSRVCVKDYEKAELGLSIPKGAAVDVPVAFIHKDPEHFENPEEFDPEHFSVESKAKRHPYAFMPFGFGPRNCIGIRFAQVEVKTAIAHLVNSFLIEPVKSSTFPLKTKLVGHGVQIPGEVDIKLTPIS